MIQINLFTKQTHRHKNKLMIYQRKKGGEGINWEFRINRYTLLYLEQINSKDLVHITGNYLQYLIISYNGKESEKE